MNITTQRLFEVFKKKISNHAKAEELGISLNEYIEVKEKIQDFLSEKSEQINDTYVQELDSVLKGDSTPYRLLKSRAKTATEVDYKSALKNVEVNLIPPFSFKLKSTLDPACGVLSLQDLHFGKVGSKNLREDIKTSLEYVLGKALKGFKLTDVYLVLGGDILNVDTFTLTTTMGTPQQNELTATEMYIEAFEIMCETIQLIKATCDTLHIIYIPGNHDRLSSFHLLHALSQSFKKWKDIIFDIDYTERKVKTYGNSMLCFEHGDVRGNNPLVYATEFPLDWGITKFRKLYLGHLHFKRTKEYITENEMHGFTTKILPSLSSTDYWHYHKKYTGSKKSAVLDIIDVEKGSVAEYVYTV